MDENPVPGAAIPETIPVSTETVPAPAEVIVPVATPKEVALAVIDRVLANLATEIGNLPHAPGNSAVGNARATLFSVQHLLASDRALVAQG